MSDGGRVNANVRFQISPQEIRGETPARARLNSIQVGGLNHGQVRQQNVPLPPALVAPAIVAPAATKTHGMIVDDQTTLDQITNHFSGQSAGKTLRLHVHQDGTKELHLHNDNKKSNALGGRFAKLAGKAGFNVLGRATPEQKH